MKLDVLAIGAHCDDVEIVSGGTVIKLVDKGYAVGIVDLTAGESGSRGNSKRRIQEAKKASETMGLKYRYNLKLPDAGLFLTQQNALLVAKIIRKTRPQLVILPYWQQRHPDHGMACEIGYRGCFLSGLKKMPIEGKAYRPRKILYASSFYDVDHTFVVDISEQFKRKCEAVACYKSQFDTTENNREVYPPARDIFDFMEALNRRYGYMIGARYGECFIQKEKLHVDDPFSLLGKSI